MWPKSQFSSCYSAHKASAPGAQQLSLTSSTTQLRSCSLRSVQLRQVSPPGLSSRSLAAQKNTTIQLRHSAYEPTSSVRRAQLPNSRHAAQESDRIRQFSPQGLSAQEPSNLIEVLNCSTTQLRSSTQAMQPRS